MNILLAALPILGAYIIGFLAAIPPAGPVAAAIAEQSAAGNHRRAFYVGLGASIVESVYAYAAAGFLSLVSRHLEEIKWTARVVASVLLPTLGVRFLLARERPRDHASARGGGFWLGVTAAINPMPLVMWTTVATLFASRGLPVRGSAAALFGLAAAGGVFTWNTILVEILQRSKGVLPQARLKKIVRVLGLLLIAAGLWSAIELVVRAA
jgi:threonine/homoserine/homoserine lactone efflux protein